MNFSYSLMMTPRSPFARRVRLAFMRLGLDFTSEEVNPFQPSERFLQANPLGLVPVLVIKDETRERFLPDSATILEFLHEIHGEKIWPMDPEARLHVRTVSTLAEGVMGAAVSYFLETQRAHPDPEWLTEHQEVIRRALHAVNVEGLAADSQASWDLGVALEYLDLRLPHYAWRGEFPRLQQILDDCRTFAGFRTTTPPLPVT